VIEAAIALTKRAAEHGRPAALARVGRWHLFGISGCDKDARQAVRLLHAAASAGDRDAQYWLGYFFSRAESFTGDAAAPHQGSVSEGERGEAAHPLGGAEVADPEQRAELAKAVIAEIRAMRKVAKQNKVRRVQGLPPLPLPSASPGGAPAATDAAAPAAPAAESFGAEDPARVPLATHRGRAVHWLMRAAAAEHADAQVLLGNIHMAAGEHRQGIAWYEVAAQVAHHSLPGTMAGAGAGASAEAGTMAGAGAGEGAAAVAATQATAAASAPAAAHTASGSTTGDAPDTGADADAAAAASAQPAAPNAAGALPHPDALYNLGMNLGMVYHDGVAGVVPRDRLRAAQYFRRAGEAKPLRQGFDAGSASLVRAW